MGFFSGLFGTKSEWDGSNYVEEICGEKLWHKNFIDKDEMKRYGQEIALQDDPLGARVRIQSPLTIVGELIYLLQTCELHDDDMGCIRVSRAIEHLIKNHEDKLHKFASMRLSTTSYSSYL